MFGPSRSVCFMWDAPAADAPGRYLVAVSAGFLPKAPMRAWNMPMRRTPAAPAISAASGCWLTCAGSRTSAAATYMTQPPTRLGSGAALKGVGNCSLVMPLTKCGVAFAASTPAMKHSTIVDVMTLLSLGPAGEAADGEVHQLP